MGYCWTSGKKVNGKWSFLKCDGRKNSGPGTCYPESTKDNPRCIDCAEWTKTWKQAKTIVEDWEKTNGDDNK